MTHKISVLVRADVKRQSIDLVITGCLNSDTAEALYRQIARARGLGPATAVLVDLTGARHVDPIALSALQAQVSAPDAEGSGKSVDVEFRVPATVSSCDLGSMAELAAG